MKKRLPVILSSGVIILFIVVMNTGGFLKKPFGEKDDFIKYMNLMEESIQENAWKSAEQSWKDASAAWNKISKRVQFSVERDDMDRLTIALGRLKGALAAEDASAALIALFEAKEIWQNLEQ